MLISKLFLAASTMGLLTGIAIMYFLNGLLGHASLKEGVIAFAIFQGIAFFIGSMVFTRVRNIWNLTIRYPIPKPEK